MKMIRKLQWKTRAPSQSSRSDCWTRLGPGCRLAFVFRNSDRKKSTSSAIRPTVHFVSGGLSSFSAWIQGSDVCWPLDDVILNWTGARAQVRIL